MKKTLLSIVLTFAGAYPAVAQTPAQPAQPSSQAAPAPQQQKKEIKDPAEYNAYVGAVQQQDAAAKVSGLEAFLTQYPNSVMKEDALELLMGAYQQANNAPKVIETANRLLAVNPDNARALVLIAYNERASQKWADAQQHAQRGLDAVAKMSKPDGASDADFQKQKTSFTALLNGIAGFSALQLKDYPNAQKYLRAAVEADPNNVENIYPLALAYLSATPPDYINGLFFIARAANLVPDPKAKSDLTKFGHSKYVKYHAGEDGWNELLAQTATTPLPPAGFTIKPAPTPAEQAAALVKDKTPDQLKALSFGEWQLVLSQGTPEDGAKVWDAIKGVTLQMEGLVISATADQIMIAESSDDIEAKKADITLTMNGPIPAKLMPKEGATLDFEGTPASYTPNPFMMTMEKGQLLTKAAPAGAKKPPVHRKPTQ